MCIQVRKNQLKTWEGFEARSFPAFQVNVIYHLGKGIPKNREAGFGPASNRLAETFSLNRLLSSPQQPSAVALHSTNNFKMVNPRKLARPANGRCYQFRTNLRNDID